jgi:anti-sigma28 factor (negative regulator of flagellin synthesis)
MKIENQNGLGPGLEGKPGLEGRPLPERSQEAEKAPGSELQAAGAGRAGEAAGAKARAARAGESAGAGAAAGLDQLQLSGLSRSLRMEHSESPERIEYLEKLSLEVARGRYEIDAEGISGDLIREALEFGGETSPESPFATPGPGPSADE